MIKLYQGHVDYSYEPVGFNADEYPTYFNPAKIQTVQEYERYSVITMDNNTSITVTEKPAEIFALMVSTQNDRD